MSSPHEDDFETFARMSLSSIQQDVAEIKESIKDVPILRNTVKLHSWIIGVVFVAVVGAVVAGWTSKSEQSQHPATQPVLRSR